MKKDLIRIENHGRSTYLYIAGIRLGKGILGINFSQTEEEPMTPKLTVTVDVRAFLQELSEIKPPPKMATVLWRFLDKFLS